MGFYERQFGERDRSRPAAAEKPAHPLQGRYYSLLTDNFRLILFFVPAFCGLYCGLASGIFLLAALGLALLIPAGPAIAAMYDRGFQIARKLASHESRSFFESVRLNLRQGMQAMALFVPALLLLALVLAADAPKPVWVTVCLCLGGYLLQSIMTHTFAQIALVDLPMRLILKNALLLTLTPNGAAIAVTAVQLGALVILYRWIGYAFAGVLFLGPALLTAWSAVKLFPRLERVLVAGDAD